MGFEHLLSLNLKLRYAVSIQLASFLQEKLWLDRLADVLKAVKQSNPLSV